MDGFSGEAGVVNPAMPRSNWHATFADAADRTLVTTKVVRASAQDLQKSIDMGLEAGMASTMARLDDLLPSLAA